MRICLVGSLNLNGYYSRDREPALLSLPLGLLSLAAVLESAPHHVSIVDFNYALCDGDISLDDDFYSRALARIEALCPEVVGFSTMCNSYHITLRLAQHLKARMPHILVILGGPQASVVDTQTLEAFPFIDFIVRGEAESSLPKLLDCLSQQTSPARVPGLTYRTEGRILRNPDAPLQSDLDLLPSPAYHLFPYQIGAAPSIDAGRGCPFACSFCSTSTFWRRRFRLKSIDRLIGEMSMLKREYQASSFTFMHDLFTVNRRRLHAFCDRLESEKMDVSWTCSARVDCVDRALLKRMAETGCWAVFYGVETGSPTMQREIHKNLKLEQVWSAVEGTIAAKMRPTVSFIAGFPMETEADLEQTLDLIQDLIARSEVNVQLHILAPQTGTPDYDHYRDRLRFDGYYSDIAGTAQRFLEPEWFQQYPDLFSSFYYFETDGVSRQRLTGLDLFVHGPCSVMRNTVRQLLSSERSLWKLYCDWRDWADARGLGSGPMTGGAPDQYLLDFYDFAASEVAAGRADFDLGHAQDEILAFYLQYYGQVPVRYVA